MAKVSTNYFYFSKFSGYSGLQHALAADYVEIPDLENGELTQPGHYTNILVNELRAHSSTLVEIELVSQLGSLVHSEVFNISDSLYSKVIELGGLGAILNITLESIIPPERYTAGRALGKYYIINPFNEIVSEFDKAQDLLGYCYRNKINIRGVQLKNVYPINTGRN